MKLHNYQVRIIDFVKSKLVRTNLDKDTLSVIFSVGMGLGKTAAVLHIIAGLPDRARVLIVAPKRVAETVWMQEAEKWGMQGIAKRMIIVNGTKEKRLKALADEKNIKIIGRDNLSDLIEYKLLEWDCIILDELTSYKSPISIRGETVRTLKSKIKIGLTGTFIANGAIDIFPQAAAVGLEKCHVRRSKNGKHKWSPEFNAWRDMFFVNVMAGSGLPFEKWKSICPIETIIEPYRENIFTLDSSDWLEIPEVEYIEHKITLPPRQMQEYLSLESQLYADINGKAFAIEKDGAKFAKLQTLCCGFVYDGDHNSIITADTTKIDAVVDFCVRAAGENEQVLLFYAFVQEAKLIAEGLKKAGLRYCSPNNKNFLSLWNSGEIDVLVAHPASAGHGLNLQYGGRLVVWSSITYNFEFWAQSNARLIRQGQTRGVQVHTFATVGTVEAKMYGAIRKKEVENQEFVNLTK